MAKNTNLRNAKKAKNDQFYTQLSDIEREINHYDNAYFKDKIVLCNCNDGTKSKFWEYFHKNFKVKGLKKLVGISYALQADGKGKVYIYEGGTTADSDMDLNSCVEIELKGSGDFREEECIEYLKGADVVVTNPPFSLLREYVAVLMKHNKKFIILGPYTAINYKEFFPLLKDNKLWLGYKSGDMAFTVPDSSTARETRFWIDENGQKWRSLGNVCWYTNLDTQKRHETLRLYRNYNPEEYPTYDNYNAINVNKTAEIPMDYDGIMGVPITFMDKYNPEQFEIIRFRKGIDDKDLSINGKCPYTRILIRKR